MINEFKKIFITIGIVFAALSIYFGSLLPFAKSQRYINSLGAMSSIKSLDDFMENFDKTFDFYSPIGDEEVVKFLGSTILGIISQKEQPENISRYLVEYIEPKLFKNNIRHLLMGGQMYSILWQKYRKEEYLKKAEEYYLKSMDIGPKLPPVLYGLFDIYRANGNREKAEEIRKIILQYWPEDEMVKNL